MGYKIQRVKPSSGCVKIVGMYITLRVLRVKIYHGEHGRKHGGNAGVSGSAISYKIFTHPQPLAAATRGLKTGTQQGIIKRFKYPFVPHP